VLSEREATLSTRRVSVVYEPPARRITAARFLRRRSDVDRMHRRYATARFCFIPSQQQQQQQQQPVA